MKIIRLLVLFSLALVLSRLLLADPRAEPATVVVMGAGGDISVVDGDAPFLTVRGLTRRETPGWIATHFRAPDKPETVSVTLKTADGRTWRAAWTAIP